MQRAVCEPRSRPVTPQNLRSRSPFNLGLPKIYRSPLHATAFLTIFARLGLLGRLRRAIQLSLILTE